MGHWVCGIRGCGAGFEDPAELVRHQVTNHEAVVCGVCGETCPAGFLSIRHAFEEHTRAQYLRAYDADSDDIRVRENVKDEIERAVDVPAIMDELGVEKQAVTVSD